jgi:TPR repeat protein
MNWLREYRIQVILLLFLGGMAFLRWNMGSLEIPPNLDPSGETSAQSSDADSQTKSDSQSNHSAPVAGGASSGGDQSAAIEGSGDRGASEAKPAASALSERAQVDEFNEKRRVNWEAACKTGDADSCQDLAEWLVETGNKQEAVAHLNKACDGSLDAFDACASVGELLSPAEISAAKSLCSDGNAKACIKYAGSLPDDKASEAKTFMSRACTLGMTSACGTVGAFMKESEVAAATDACDAGDAKACVSVAGFHSKNNQEGRAVNFVNKACDQGLASSCLEWGENATKDAVSKLDSECQNSSPGACLRMAGFLVKEGNEDQAQKLVARACALGNSDACKIGEQIRKNR